MLLYENYIPLFHPFVPCSAIARDGLIKLSN